LKTQQSLPELFLKGNIIQWNLENLNVSAVYLDSIPVTGMVTLSRVQYGGTVCHHITLTSPITVYGAVRDSVIVDHKNIQTISSS
jgi:multidrug efflux pump subunit AcrB